MPPFRLSWSRAVVALSLALVAGGLWLRGEVAQRQAELEAQRERVERARLRQRDLLDRLQRIQERTRPAPHRPAPDAPAPGRGVPV